MRVNRTTYPPFENLMINSLIKFSPITTPMQNLMDRKHYFPGKSLLSLILRLVSSSNIPQTYNKSKISKVIYVSTSHCRRKEPRKPTAAALDSSLCEILKRNSKAAFASCFVFSLYFFGRHSKLSVRNRNGYLY